MRRRLQSAGLADIADKVEARERLTFDDGVRLFEAPDSFAVGWLANRERERRHGDRTYFNHNLRLEATNVCEASCLFCSFARLTPDKPGAHTKSVEQVLDRLRARDGEAADRGPHGERPPSGAAVQLLHGPAARPEADSAGYSPEVLHRRRDRVLRRPLRQDAIARCSRSCARPGSTRCRAAAPRSSRRGCGARSAHDKCDGDRYLSVHRTAHQIGMRTNATMLYGHIETMAERVDHLLRLRDLQDETGGLQAFIPLAFHPDNNQMRKLPAPSAADTLRVHAVARLLLDNVDHIKAYWISSGVDVAQTALWFGADDLDGTVQEETIYHMAGSTTPAALSTAQIEKLIFDAGRVPIERDTLYNVVRVITGVQSTAVQKHEGSKRGATAPTLVI